MRTVGMWRLFPVMVLTAGLATAAGAQEPQAPTREAAIEQAQAEKAKTLHPYEPNKAEKFLDIFETRLTSGGLRFHPFFESAYSGGGFTLGAGYARHVSSYNRVDVRGSYTISGYKRAEVEFTAPRMFNRRGALSLLGGWREATQVGFYGIGPNTSKDDRTNYAFQQPYASALFTIFPTRRMLMLRGGVEWSEWSQEPGQGTFPSVETVYTPATLPGLGTKTAYLHSQGTIGIDWRTSPGYSRRGGFYGVTVHDYHDSDKEFGFDQVDYEVIQHLPILREAWVISLRGRVQTSFDKSGQQTPFFMLPSVGGGSSLRGYSSLAVPRPEQSAPPGGVAHHGQPLLRYRVLLRCGEGHRAHVRSRFRRAEERLRLRSAFPWTVLHPAARRDRQEQRSAGVRLLGGSVIF